MLYSAFYLNCNKLRFSMDKILINVVPTSVVDYSLCSIAGSFSR